MIYLMNVIKMDLILILRVKLRTRLLSGDLIRFDYKRLSPYPSRDRSQEALKRPHIRMSA